MLRRCLPFLILLTVFSSTESFSQEEKWPKTLLWRISGNGLTKPSYVYGTMHLQDKRVFHFTDSVYKAIETTEGLALEVDFRELIDSMINLGIEDGGGNDFDPAIKVDKKKLGKDIDTIFKKLGIDADNLTAKNLKKIREYRVKKLTRQGEMPTIVDGYLFGLAVRQGKWTGGIEDVTDQLNLVDEIGDVLTPEKAFEPESKLLATLEAMIRIYMDSDLEGINSFIENSYDRDHKNKLLVTRNAKMARRMDSLLKWRSMFFAVGAAHLPGDSGVIRLLRGRGFEVEPVFSPRTITPQSYSSKLAAAPWKTISDDPFYSIDLPGTPSEFDRFGEAAKVKMYFDLPTMSYYMAGHTVRAHENYAELNQTFRDMVKNMGANPARIKVKDVSGNGLIGVEGSFEVSAGYYKVRLLQKKKITYILLAGSTKKGNVNDEDVNRFYSSFIAKDAPLVSHRFQSFTIPGKDFTVDLPGTPRPNKEIDKNAEASNWYFTTYDLADREKGLYYMVQVRDIMPGHFLEGDSTYFDVFASELSADFELKKKEQFTFQGWRAMNIEFMDMTKLRYKMFIVIRGNRVYTLFGGGQKTNAPEIDTVFGSFRLLPPSAGNWTKESAAGFSTLAPAPLVLQPEDNDDDEGELHYISYDNKNVISYEVMVTPFPKYFWAESDSVFFRRRLEGNRQEGDTLLSYQKTKNGQHEGIEFVLRNAGSNTVRKIRSFVNGDSLYMLFAILPEAYLENETPKKFFTEFRLNQEKKPTFYSNKAKELFSALLTKDSAEFASAAAVLDRVYFTKQDLPVLHEAFLKDYEHEYSYQTINAIISRELEELMDSSTVDFIAKNYKQIKEDATSLQYEALDVLASIRNEYSYRQLKSLLLAGPPQGERDMTLAYSLADSLELTKVLYPEILQLSDNREFSDIIALVSTRMIDSGLLTVKDFLPYREPLMIQATHKLAELKEGKGNWWEFYDWPLFIGVFNDPESNRLLNDYIKAEDLNIQYAAAIALIKNDQTVTKAVLERLAESNEFRLNLYTELKKMNKLGIYPAKYATQQKIAESEIYLLGSEDDEYPSSVSFIAEKKMEFMGKEGIFYIFKIGYGEKSDASFYTGITGPYTNTKEIITDTKASGIYYEEEYSKSEIYIQLRYILDDWEDYYKKYPNEY